MMAINQDNTPLVSVIIAFKDEEKFLEEAIQSVLDQSWNHWELWLVDDGSSDRSAEIAHSFAEGYPNINYLEHQGHQNKGISASRNLALANCKGELICFLDGDDIYLPEKLSAQISNFITYSTIDMLIDATIYWYSWGPGDNRSDYTGHIGGPDKAIFEPGNLNRRFLDRTAVVPCMGGIMVRRSLLKKIKGFEEQFTGMYEDQVFYHKAALRGTIMITREIHDKYRQHENSMCFQVSKNGHMNALYRQQFLEWLLAYINESENEDLVLKSYIRLELTLNKYPRIQTIYRRLRKLQATLLNMVQGRSGSLI